MQLSDLTILLKVYGGSRAYGTEVATSDIDIRGVVLPPDEYIIGLSRFEQYEGNEEDDMVLYDLRKFANLLLKGNPNALEIVWAPILEQNKFFVTSLREKVWPKIISKQLIKPHLGMVTAHLARIDRPGRNCGEKGKSAIEKYGYNTKDASHVIRVLEQCVEILMYEELTLPRANAQEILAIKQGEWTLDKVKSRADQLISKIKQLEQIVSLPDLPDFHYVEKWVMEQMKWHLGV